MKTRVEWETIMDASASANGLPLSTSGVAEWKLWRDLVITLVMLLEGIVNIFKKEVEVHVNNEQHGSLYWYRQISKEFQYGDTLTVNNGIVQYAPVNIANRIIAQVSVKEVLDDVLVLKVAKENATVLEALTNAELLAYQAYIHARKLPGTKINIYSNNADVVFIDGVFYYDTLFDPAVVNANVVTALNTYKNNFAFDSVLYRSGIIDVIMNAEGMKGLGNLDIFVNTTEPLTTYIELLAGYFNIDASSSFNMQPAI